MLTIGIIDVTTVGSTLCQRTLSELGGPTCNHPEFYVHSLPFSSYRTAVINKDWKTVEQLIGISIRKLEKLEPDFIILPANTPHYAYERYATKTSIPIINLIELTAEACQQARLKKVAILGSKATMTDGLYQSKLAQRSIELVTPSEPTCNAIHNFIVEEIIPGQVKADSRQKVLDQLKHIDCDGFILGCTELPEVYSTEDFGKIAIDTTRLLAETAFNIAQKQDCARLKRYCQLRQSN